MPLLAPHLAQTMRWSFTTREGSGGLPRKGWEPGKAPLQPTAGHMSDSFLRAPWEMGAGCLLPEVKDMCPAFWKCVTRGSAS